MTKKDYITIANALKPYYKDSSTPNTDDPRWYGGYDRAIIDVIGAISKALSKDNPKFNPVRFLDYIRQ